MTAKQVNWGILSTARIGLEKVIPAIQKSSSSNVLGIASRNAARSARAANDLGIQKSYASYEALIDDPEIDAIYNPLPNHMHVDWTLAAVRAGKHVLCEKPIGLSVRDAERLRGCPENILVAEAFMVRYHPQWLRVREMVRNGELGEVRAIQAAFSYFNDNGEDIRNRPEAGGGAIMDIGCYPITAGRFLFEDEPRRVMALIDRDSGFQTDRMASVIADFGEGRQLSFIVSTQLCPYQTLNVFGTKARAEIMIPYNAPADEETAVIVDSGESLDGSLAGCEMLPVCDQYTLQAERFAQAILTGTALPYGIEDSIASMRVLDAIFASEKQGAWINL
ncbi:Gfo/Idh/MocA family oxidoreductase [Thalassospira sp. GO-4]|uniref:Gfo/Idh/MocA family protein n=1 Tax=Rhodospirillales TaxID=204441 RepID=UPI0020252DC0|nr:Gfo/Idh/MocA family oxidoreductase [Thalassospira sp. GO-4]URK17521.1 Gfo/Idh/MocA family oxidoreductase [Thalassospira sp. GO-4]